MKFGIVCLVVLCLANPARGQQQGLPQGQPQGSSQKQPAVDTEPVKIEKKPDKFKYSHKKLDMEWVSAFFGFSFGGTTTTLKLFTLRWKHFYLTLLQGSLLIGPGVEGAHVGMGLGLPITLGDRTELRLGIGAAGGMVFAESDAMGTWMTGLILTPEVMLHVHGRVASLEVGVQGALTPPPFFYAGSPLFPSAVVGVVF